MARTTETILEDIKIIDIKLYMTDWTTERGRFDEEWLVSRRQQLEQELKGERHGQN